MLTLTKRTRVGKAVEAALHLLTEHDIPLDGVLPDFAAVEAAIDRFSEEFEQAKRSGKFTEAGLRDWHATRVKSLAGAMQQFDAGRQRVAKRFTEERDRVLSPRTPAKSENVAEVVVAEMRGREYRDLLRAMPRAEVERRYLTALEQDDHATVAVINGAPAAENLISAEIRARADAILIDRDQDCRKLRAMQIAFDQVRVAVTDATSGLLQPSLQERLTPPGASE